MSHFVYILKSIPSSRQYIGSCKSVPVRFKQHNDGRVHSTKAYRPWTIVRVEQYDTKTEALKRERQLKRSGYARKMLKANPERYSTPLTAGRKNSN